MIGESRLVPEQVWWGPRRVAMPAISSMPVMAAMAALAAMPGSVAMVTSVESYVAGSSPVSCRYLHRYVEAVPGK